MEFVVIFTLRQGQHPGFLSRGGKQKCHDELMKRKIDCEKHREEVHMDKLNKCEEVATLLEARQIMTGSQLDSSVSQFLWDLHTCEQLGHVCFVHQFHPNTVVPSKSTSHNT